MKKLIVLTCFLMLFILIGCCWQARNLVASDNPTGSSESIGGAQWEKDMFGRLFNTDADQADEVFQAFISAVQAQDAHSLKAMFSDYAIDASENMDTQIDQLFALYTGEMTSFDRYGPGSHSEQNGDKYLKEIYASYNIYTSEADYRMAIKFCTIDSADSDNIGIQSIYIVQRTGRNAVSPYWGSNDWNLGINVEE